MSEVARAGPCSEAAQCIDSTQSLPAAARSIQSKHFLPFFLSLLIYKTGIAIQLPFGKHFEVDGQSTLVLYIGADVFQPSCPLEIITLHSLGSRDNMSMVFSCSSLLLFVKPLCPGTAEVQLCIFCH